METKVNKLSEQQIAALKRPLPPEAIKPHPTKPYLSTIKAPFIIERLHEVFGVGGWLIENQVIEQGDKHVVIKATFRAPEYGITVPDIFGGNDNPDRGDAYKGACTDALTKIGSYLYIGMDVYKGLTDRTERQVPTYEKKAATNGHTPGKIEPKAEGAELPWLSEEQFTKAKYRLSQGEEGVLENCKRNFRMKKAYREELEQMENFNQTLSSK